METRAHYVLIGAFTIAGLLGILAFFLWFARVELDRTFAYYDIRFPSVSGLGNASDVRFSGLPVGQVVDVRLAPERDGTILVRVEVSAETPVRADSVATIEAQGVTGVSFVAISPGTPEAPLLQATQSDPTPEIAAGRSTLQSLTEDAPALLSEALQVVQRVNDLLGGENQNRIDSILANVEDASNTFARTLEDFSSVAGSVTDFASQLGRFNATLETLGGDLGAVLQRADSTLASIDTAAQQAGGLLAEGTATLGSARTTIEGAGAYIAGDLTDTTAALSETLVDLQAQAATLSQDAQALMGTLETTGMTATERLEEARATVAAADALLARLDQTVAAVGDTAARIDGLVQTEAGPLLRETRALIAEATRAAEAVTRTAETDLPAIVADIRAATETARQATDAIAQSLTSASGRVDGLADAAEAALTGAAQTFDAANDTLAAINGALETGDRALIAAERAFSGADRVINEDLSGILAGLESTLDRLNTAVGAVSDDLPVISADIRAASQSAARTFDALSAISTDAAPAVRDFTNTALPLYTRLAQETRMLIANLDKLATQIERDPARFFLNRDTPEFRR